jgi:hypothetical protein
MEASEEGDQRRRLAEFGRLLAAAAGYQVQTVNGRRLGRVEHVRYGQHADWPDEIVVRFRWRLGTRRRVYPLRVVREVDPRARTVVIAAADRPEPTAGSERV